MCMSSIPTSVSWAASNDLNPNMGRVIRFTPRWSCSTILLRRSYWIPGSYAPTLFENHDSFLRLLKNKDFKEERMTKVELDATGTSTTLESNKSLRVLGNDKRLKALTPEQRAQFVQAATPFKTPTVRR